jgi:hypothetical protein
LKTAVLLTETSKLTTKKQQETWGKDLVYHEKSQTP